MQVFFIKNLIKTAKSKKIISFIQIANILYQVALIYNEYGRKYKNLRRILL
jgi:hypothetical protein